MERGGVPEGRLSSATFDSRVKIRYIQNHSLTELWLLSVLEINREDEGKMADTTWISKRVISLKRSTGIAAGRVLSS